MQELERRRDRWVSAGLSVLLHGTLIAVLVYGWWSFRHRPQPAPTLAIDATVVSSKALRGGSATLWPITPLPKPVAPPPPTDEQTVPPPPIPVPAQTVNPPQSTPAPKPTPAADDQTVPPPPPESKETQAAAEQKAEAEAQRKQAAQREAEEKARRKVADQAAAQREAKEAAARAKAAAAKKHAAEQRRLAEAKRKAEEKRKAQEQAKLAAQRKLEAQQKAEAERRAAEAKALALNQAELEQNVAADERALAARSGPAMATWVQQITARIQGAWIRPPTAKPGIDCTLYVTQVPGGQIVNVKLGACNGDEAVRQSIQDAAYRASPLPPPPDPALFERDLQIEFKPTD